MKVEYYFRSDAIHDKCWIAMIEKENEYKRIDITEDEAESKEASPCLGLDITGVSQDMFDSTKRNFSKAWKKIDEKEFKAVYEKYLEIHQQQFSNL